MRRIWVSILLWSGQIWLFSKGLLSLHHVRLGNIYIILRLFIFVYSIPSTQLGSWGLMVSSVLAQSRLFFGSQYICRVAKSSNNKHLSGIETNQNFTNTNLTVCQWTRWLLYFIPSDLHQTTARKPWPRSSVWALLNNKQLCSVFVWFFRPKGPQPCLFVFYWLTSPRFANSRSIFTLFKCIQLFFFFTHEVQFLDNLCPFKQKHQAKKRFLITVQISLA